LANAVNGALAPLGAAVEAAPVASESVARLIRLASSRFGVDRA
jgi:hypothetical protein